MILFNYYDADIKKSHPLGIVSLDYMLNSIKNPKKNIKHIFEQIRLAEQNKDAKLKQELKTKLYSFTPCVFVNGPRKYVNITKFTGLLVLDFDHLESPEYAERFKIYLFDTYKFIVASWLSASKHGVRAIVSIPNCENVDQFKAYFGGIELDFKSYIGFDTAPKNCILPLFISYDENLLQRNDYTTYTKKYVAPVIPQIKQYIVNDKTSVIEKIILNNINEIVNTGHVKLRATAYLLGGYVGAGYIEYDYSIQMINKMIDCNSYLSQKASVYKKTAKTMIDKGINQPTYLKN
jgi:hypothetical protein